MRIGILIPTRAAVMQSAARPPVDECWAMARHADEAGYDALWVGDSIVAKPRLEVMTTLAYLAAITQRVRLGTAVLLPALRHPVVMAHLIANVDQISRGRLVLGLGVGGPQLAAEWAAMGMDFKRRARRTEEQIAIWRKLWSGEPVTYDGPGVALREHTIGPLPWNPQGPPLIITAGNSGTFVPATLDRFARLGDGLICTWAYAEECRTLRQKGEEALAAHGRSLPTFPIVAYVSVRLEKDVETARKVQAEFLAGYYGPSMRDRGTAGLGPADAVTAALKEYEAAGATDLCIRFSGDGQMDQLQQFTRDVLPAFQ